mgnify:CR=1 FL=1
MPSEHSNASGESSPVIDAGLLSPVSVGYDEDLSDAVFALHLVTAEVALVRAWALTGVAPAAAADAVEAVYGFSEPGSRAEPGIGPDSGTGPDADLGAGFGALDLPGLARAAVAGGNPVIPLVGLMRGSVPEHARSWVHRGATSQDIMDTALMLLARDAGIGLLATLDEIEDVLAVFAERHRDLVAAARTLTQHAVPTTVGLRAANWARGVRRAALKLDLALEQLPVQLAGAGGTLASFVEIGGREAAEELPAAYAELLGLAAPEGPWHTVRWPVTELGDALVQAVDALGVIAADVATLSRTEIGELAEGAGGGSSAMPQKSNPAGSVLIRSAAIRAPQLAATLHAAAALAVDERPDGAWHAEWQTLRELLRLACGAAGHTATLVSGLRVDEAAVARNLALTGGLIVAERLSIELGPLIGADRLKRIFAAAGRGASLVDLLRAEPELDGVDIAALIDPAGYTGLAGRLVDRLADSDALIDRAEEEPP